MSRTEEGRAYERQTGHKLLIMAASYILVEVAAQKAGFAAGDFIYIAPASEFGGLPERLRGVRNVRLYIVGPAIGIDESLFADRGIEVAYGI